MTQPMDQSRDGSYPPLPGRHGGLGRRSRRPGEEQELAGRSRRPIELSVRLGWYILKNRIRGRKRFPLVTMLEPLEMCNLACIGCGRIREYKPVLDKMMPVDEALNAVNALLVA